MHKCPFQKYVGTLILETMYQKQFECFRLFNFPTLNFSLDSSLEEKNVSAYFSSWIDEISYDFQLAFLQLAVTEM